MRPKAFAALGQADARHLPRHAAPVQRERGARPARRARAAARPGRPVPRAVQGAAHGLEPAEVQPAESADEGLIRGYVYFVHSYHVLPEHEGDLLATTDYHGPVTAIVGRGGLYGMQFHPEKSGELGMRLLGQFLSLTTKVQTESS